MKRLLTLLVITLFSKSLVEVSAFSKNNFKFKYEYKYSFKGPHLSQSSVIPFWQHNFDAVPGLDQVRLVPSLRARYGAVWSKKQFPHNQWQVEMSFRVTGRGVMGADGMAFWFTETSSNPGVVFGSMDQWNGLAILFDSFDNDGRKNNPYVSIFVNDGSVLFDHINDGYSQTEHGCIHDFRNRPYPVKARIIYADREVQLYLGSGNSLIDDYSYCASVKDVTLPSNCYFGVSAATGAIADDHDVLKFETWSLESAVKESEGTPNVEEKKEKWEEEYQKSVEEFNKELERFKEEHPEQVQKQAPKPDDLFQGDSSPELQSVFSVQSSIKQSVNALQHIVTMVLEKQDSILRTFDEQPARPDVAKSHHVQNTMLLEQSTYQKILDLQQHIESVKSATIDLSSHIGRMTPLTGVGSIDASARFEAEQRMANIAEDVALITDEVTFLQNHQLKAEKPTCPKIPEISCITTTVLVGVAVAEVLLLLFYFTCKQPSVDPGKKYF